MWPDAGAPSPCAPRRARMPAPDNKETRYVAHALQNAANMPISLLTPTLQRLLSLQGGHAGVTAAAALHTPLPFKQPEDLETLLCHEYTCSQCEAMCSCISKETLQSPLHLLSMFASNERHLHQMTLITHKVCLSSGCSK